MASIVSKKDEAFRQYALKGAPVQVLLSACAPLALFQALLLCYAVAGLLAEGLKSLGGVYADILAGPEEGAGN